MLGWFFLAGLLGGIPWILLTDYRGWASLFTSTTGFVIEPFTGTSLFTDWLYWALTAGNYAGLLMLIGMISCGLVIVMNVTGFGKARVGDPFQ